MAEILVKLALNKLCDAALKEIFFLCGVSDKIERVKRELNRIYCFLQDADRKSARDERVKNWVKELREVSYLIEDTIHLFVMDLDELNGKYPAIQKPKLTEKLTKMITKPKELFITRKFGKKIDKILARIDEIAKSRETFGIKNIEESEVGVTVPFRRHTIPELDNTKLVGVGDVKEKIVEQLLDEKCLRRSVVSIVGPGGLGKTTVAEKAYSSNAIKNKFDVRIWLSISRTFTLIDIFKKMLKTIGDLNDSEKDEGEDHFIKKVNKSLRGKKYLVVLDDVWSDVLWSQINLALPDDKNGSRVLMTSKSYNIPKAADHTKEPHELRFLDEEESTELLLRTALSNRDDEKDCCINLSDIAKQLAKKCGGLPLALVVLGGRLSLKPTMHSIWEKMLNTMVWIKDGKTCLDSLATSYDDMPVALKPCFMYFAGLPEDYEICGSDLIQLWVAEGFIPQISNKMMEDVAEEYLEELAQRSMIQVLGTSIHDNSILMCRMHDLLREVAMEKAKENNFLTVCANEDEEQDLGKARRLAVHSDFIRDDLMKYASPNLRSILCFNSMPSDFSRQRLIKVIYAEYVDFQITEGLSQLRYFNVSGQISAPNQEYFDKIIRSMKFLQTFFIPLIEISQSIWHIKTLRHISGVRSNKNFCFFQNSQPIELKNLQTLVGVNCTSLKTTNLPIFPNLRELDIKIEEGFPWKTVVAFLCTLKKLLVLHIRGHDIPIEVVDMEGYPFYQHLTSLTYLGSFFEARNITFRTTMFPVHLIELILHHVQLGQHHISVLEKLPALKKLTFGGVKMDKNVRFSATSFPHLEILEFGCLENIVKWEIENGAMPMLKNLNVVGCSMEVPVGLQYLTALRVLTWISNGNEKNWDRDTRSIQDACEHVPSVKFTWDRSDIFQFKQFKH